MNIISFGSLLLLVSASPSLLQNLEDDPDSVSFYRLPETLVPTFYDLSFIIDPSQNSYTGSVKITFTISDETDTIEDIYLHADTNFITIESIVLNDNINCAAGSANEVNILPVRCSPGNFGPTNSLYLTYNATFSNEDGYGMVKKSYMDEGEERVLIESNFKPIYARRAFPCMDEPDLTANFSVQVTYPEEYTAISNSLVQETTVGSDNLQTTKFSVTPEISTYLVTILISKLQAADIDSAEEYKFKIFTRAEVANFTQTVAANYYSKIVNEINNYTGIPYQDLNDIECYQVVIPESTDTMGGFGVFTYSEADLLDEGGKTSSRVTQNIVTTMSYKLIHEWYGGDVATEWWSDVWANEAVATYLKYIIGDKVNNEFNLLNQFVPEVAQRALLYDGMPFAQPLSSNESTIEFTKDIEDKLDILNFQKGASFLRMIRYVLGGDDQFQTSLSYHWQQRKDSDTDGSDLLADLTESHDRWYEFLESWIYSPGYPLLTIRIVDVTGTDVEVTELYQKRFVYPTSDREQDAGTNWTIPMNSITKYNRDFNYTLEGFYEPGDENYFFYGRGDWILFNVESGFFYRVNYDELLWRRFIATLKSETERTWIPVLSRAQMLDDIFNVARIGDVSYALAFELADFLIHETEYYPWYTAFNVFSYLIGKLDDEKSEQNLKTYILNLMENVVNIPQPKETASGETHIDVLKKVMVLKWACDLNHPGCIDYFTTEFKKFKENQSSLDDYNLRGNTFCTGIRHSENVTEDWQFLWNVYTTSPSVHEEDDILSALGCAEDEDILYSYLLKTITADSGIKSQDAVVVFNSIFSSSAGLSAAMRFFDENLIDIVSLKVNIWTQMLYTLAEKLFSDDHLTWLQNMLSNETLDDYESVREKADILTSVNNYWAHNYQVYAKEVLLSPPTTTTTITPSTTTTVITSNTVSSTIGSSEPSSEHSSGATSESTTEITTTTTEGSAEQLVPKLGISFLILLTLVLS